MVIINGKIFTMEDKTFECGYIRTKGKFIEEVGDMSAYKKIKDEQIIDVNGAWVLPGLIESHAHIGITEVSFMRRGFFFQSQQTIPLR